MAKKHAKMLNIMSDQRNKHFKRYHFCMFWHRLPSLTINPADEKIKDNSHSYWWN